MNGLVPIAALLKQVIGLDFATIGRAALDHVVRARLVACGIDTPEEYCQRLQKSPAELQELIEAVVVPETWFFRDAAAFAALASMVTKEWMPAHPKARLRALSLPCSTGEEAYSIAMALLDAGIPPSRFEVDAIDISTRALESARRALYGRNSFRGRNLAFRDQYFQPVRDRYEVIPAVRDRVRFYQGNILTDNLENGIGPYDVVFCRNVLIYFDTPTQERAVSAVQRLVAPDGFLFVGAAETVLVRQGGFVSLEHDRGFGYRKRKSAAAPIPNDKLPPKKNLSAPVPAPARKAPAKAAPRKESAPGAAVESNLDRARCLADAGQLADAAEACKKHLRDNPGSAAGWYLLGLIHDAMRHLAPAADCYRKVIYLDPDHSEALMHLALLAESSGDTAAARRLQKRAGRAGEAARR